MMEYQKISKKELVNILESLKKENCELKSVLNKKLDTITENNIDYKIPVEIKSILENGSLVVPFLSFPHAYVLTDMQGRVLFACPNMIKLFGYSEDYNYVNKSIFKFLSPERLEKAKPFFQDKKFHKEESVGIRANGDRFHIEISGNIVKNSFGEPVNIVFLVRDIDQRKKNEERLHVLSNAVEQSPVTVIITDVLGNIEYANPKAVETTGYEINELIGQNPRILKSGETDFEEYKRMWETIKSGKTWHGFFHNKKKNGELYWESSTIAPVLDDRGNIVRYLAIKEDVTEKKHLEEVVRNQNQRLNAILQAIPDLIFILSKDGVYKDFSAPFPTNNNLLGPDLIGKTLDNIFEKEQAVIHKQYINKCLENQTEISYEYNMFFDGLERLYEARLVPLDDDKVLALVRDVTEARKISDEMNKLSLAVTQSPVAVVITDTEGRVIFTNPAFQKNTGYSPEEIYGKKISILKSGLNSDNIYKDMWNTITTGNVWRNEWINKRKDGTLYWESVSISPVFDKNGNITNYLSFKEDISERKANEKEILDLNQNLEKKIEERTSELTETNKSFLQEIIERQKVENALKEKSDELETFFEVTLDLLSIHDIDGKFLKLNKAWIDTFGYESEYFEGRNILDFFHPNDIKEANYILKQLKKPGKVINVINRCKKSDGTYKFFEWCTTSEGNRIYTAGRDITENKLAEEKLRIARFEAEKANEAKSEFLSRMSHELRTPLNSILGFAQLLEMTELNDVQKKSTNHILNSGKHLLDLINEVLDISKIESGRLVLSIETISMKEIVSGTIDILQPVANLASVNIEFDNSIDEIFIKSDRQSIKQIMLNILNNAIKYNTPNGKVSIRVVNNANSDKVMISISDTGIGISKKNLSRIFEPFERIGADSTSIEGTGLGLSVVKKLINALGSEIYVESELGKGSTFWFELPKGEYLYNYGHLANSKSKNEPTESCKKTVLYIEDNASSIELLQEIVFSSCQEIRLFSESKGQKAIDTALNINPDIILLDLNLPDIHGAEILKHIRKNKTLAQTPVIIVSADALPKQIDQVMNLGATMYVTKPFDVKQIIDIFKNI